MAKKWHNTVSTLDYKGVLPWQENALTLGTWNPEATWPTPMKSSPETWGKKTPSAMYPAQMEPGETCGVALREWFSCFGKAAKLCEFRWEFSARKAKAKSAGLLAGTQRDTQKGAKRSPPNATFTVAFFMPPKWPAPGQSK